MITFTNLPIGVYILSGSIFANTSGYSLNLQFGLDGVNQNSPLANMQQYSHPSSGGVNLLTVVWFQTSVVNVYFSAGGVATYQGIRASYVRIA